MFVPRHETKPIFYPYPDALQMFFDEIATTGGQTICKAVLLLTSFIKYQIDNWVFGRLPGLIILQVLFGRDNCHLSSGTFKCDTKDNLHPDFKIGTIVNTDGWGNKLVTIFARHLDNFIMTQNFAIICQIRDFGSRQILPPRQFYLSPGLAKIAPWWLARRNSFSAKVPGLESADGATNVYSLNRRAVIVNSQAFCTLDNFKKLTLTEKTE